MERITMSLDETLANKFDDYIARCGYRNRSEALRDLIRQALRQEHLERGGDGHCVAALSYVYNHHELELASRITHVHHEHHELNLASLHVHLDHDDCLEIAILKGPVEAVDRAANAVKAERGVRYGHLQRVPVHISESGHGDDDNAHSHSHPIA